LIHAAPGHRPVSHSAPAAREGRHKRVKLWQAMRILRRFTVHELMAVCERSKQACSATAVGCARRLHQGV
jgi:hypothetical protein